MAQDYADLCPIFNRGVIKEIPFKIHTSATIATKQVQITFGRKVKLIDALVVSDPGVIESETNYRKTSQSCWIGLFKSSTSHPVGSLRISTSVAIGLYSSGNLDTLTTEFSANATLIIATKTDKAAGDRSTLWATVVVRYKEC